MTTSTDAEIYVTAGADTHRDTHMIAALDQRGAQLGVREFATDLWIVAEGRSGPRARASLAELLPRAFSPSDLP